MKREDAYLSEDVVKRFAELLLTMKNYEGFDGDIAMAFIEMQEFIEDAPVRFIKRVINQRLMAVTQQLAMDERKEKQEKGIV